VLLGAQGAVRRGESRGGLLRTRGNKGEVRVRPMSCFGENVRADLGGHLKYSQHWSGVRAGVLLGVQGAVHRGENRGGL